MEPTTPAWRPDPTGRHPYRYFDGQRWTDHVSDGRAQGMDPLAPVAPGFDLLDAALLTLSPGRRALQAMAAHSDTTAPVLQHLAFAGMFFVGLTLVGAGLMGASCHTRGRVEATSREAMIEGLPIRSASADVLDPRDEGRLVHVSGVARTEQRLVDELTGVSQDALVLERNTSMYQWVESCTQHNDRPSEGGPDVYVERDIRAPTRRRLRDGTVVRWTKCTYTKEWRDEPQSIDPKRADRYGNPAFPLEPGTQRFTPTSWRLGKLVMAYERLPQLTTAELRPIALKPEDLAGIPDAIRSRARIDGNAIYVGDPKATKVGDVRIAYVGRTEMTLTMIGELDHDGLRHHRLPDGTGFFQVREGVHSIEALAGQRRREASDSWVPHVWFGAFVLFGTFVAFWPIRAWGRVLPGPALVTGAGVLLFAPLVATALYGAMLARSWWAPDRGAAVVAAAAGAAASVLLLVASAARHLVGSRETA